jgi:hypothetical protein
MSGVKAAWWEERERYGLQTEQRMKNASERPNDGRNTFLYKGMLSHEVKGEKEKTSFVLL